MIKINGKNYHLCLVDTNILSEMLKDGSSVFDSFCKWAFTGPRIYIPSFSLFTIIEIRRRKDLYNKFCQLFSTYPCIILKGHEDLITEEILAYPVHSPISPVLLGFGGVFQPASSSLGQVLNTYFSSIAGKSREVYWLSSRKRIIQGITSLVENYPSKTGKYSSNEIRAFIDIAGFSQIAYRNKSFLEDILNKGETVLMDAFPSVKMTAFTVFYKFYVDQRKPILSDAFDIIISAPTPYVDAVLTELHQSEVIKKAKRQDSFIDNVEVFTLKDFNRPISN